MRKARDWCTGADGFVVSCDDRKNAWKLFGGYQITRNFAVEAGYANLGPNRPPFVVIRPDSLDKQMRRAEGWKKLCEKYRPEVVQRPSGPKQQRRPISALQRR